MVVVAIVVRMCSVCTHAALFVGLEVYVCVCVCVCVCVVYAPVHPLPR